MPNVPCHLLVSSRNAVLKCILDWFGIIIPFKRLPYLYALLCRWCPLTMYFWPLATYYVFGCSGCILPYCMVSTLYAVLRYKGVDLEIVFPYMRSTTSQIGKILIILRVVSTHLVDQWKLKFQLEIGFFLYSREAVHLPFNEYLQAIIRSEASNWVWLVNRESYPQKYEESNHGWSLILILVPNPNYLELDRIHITGHQLKCTFLYLMAQYVNLDLKFCLAIS